MTFNIGRGRRRRGQLSQSTPGRHVQDKQSPLIACTWSSHMVDSLKVCISNLHIRVPSLHYRRDPTGKWAQLKHVRNVCLLGTWKQGKCRIFPKHRHRRLLDYLVFWGLELTLLSVPCKPLMACFSLWVRKIRNWLDPSPSPSAMQTM